MSIYRLQGVMFSLKILKRKPQRSLSNLINTPKDTKMMFDPPDYPYKELSETYDPDDLLFNTDNVANRQLSILDTNKNTNGLAAVTNVDNQLSFHSNDSGRYFNVENTFSFQEPNSDSALNTELFVVQSDSLFSYEPNLLDENTVNQFLLPLQDSTGKSTPAESTTEETKPDLLALHSCVMCHEIFTTEADLLDHTVSIHASDDRDIAIDQTSEKTAAEMCDKLIEDNSSSNADFESDWLVCRICQRVLATALEVEPAEQLCCIDVGGKSSVSTRKLSTMFVCDLCNGLFADGDALDTHRLTCYEDDQNYYNDHNDTLDTSAKGPEICYSCDLCGKQYFSAEELKMHTLKSHRSTQSRTARRTYTSGGNNKMWNCGSCNQLFVTARELYRHKRGEDRPPGAPLMAYVCEECDKVLGSMCALHTHKKMHKVTKPGYPCRVCGRRFNQSGHLAIHMRMHTGERPYPCDLCPKAFKVKVERDDHRRTHTGERPFACSACPKTFTAAARLREHARIHTDQRPYRCEICGAAFRRPYARTVHTLIHTGEKPHECDVCGTAFRRSGDMWKHKRTLHGVQGVINEADMKKPNLLTECDEYC